MPSTSRLVKKTDFKTKTAEIKTKYLILQADKIPNITGWKHCGQNTQSFITTLEFNRLIKNLKT